MGTLQKSRGNDRMIRLVQVIACLAVAFLLFVQNLPQPDVGKLLAPLQNNALKPLGLAEGGWTMFAGQATHTQETRLLYVYQSGKSEYVQGMSLHAPYFPTLSMEVTSKVSFSSASQPFLLGYLKYQCKTSHSADPLKSVSLQRTDIQIQDLIQRNGIPGPTEYRTVANAMCI